MEHEEQIELTPEEQAIIDMAQGIEPPADEEIDLPSNQKTNEDKLYAGKYKTVDDLKDGIKNIGSDLPQYVIDGMSEAALEQYYTDLQKDFSSKNNKQEEEQKENKPDKPDSRIDDALWNDLEKQFQEKGALSDDMYNKLNKLGIPDTVVDKYIDSVKIQQEVFTNKVLDIAGGQEQYETIKAWAEDGNIPAKQLEAISKMDYDGMLIAMEGIKAKYDAANGGSNKGTRLNPANSTTSNTGYYNNQEEYMLDIADRRYGSDKKYTYAVDQKFQNSKALH